MLPVFWKVTKSVNGIEKMVAEYSPEALKKTAARDIYIATFTNPVLSCTVS